MSPHDAERRYPPGPPRSLKTLIIYVVSVFAQRWRMRLVPDHPVVPQPVVTLRLKHGLKMVVERRDPW